MPTTYYVSWDNGSDANNGLGPDASHATNKPWKSLAKLLGASGFASGDAAYVAPGTQREVVTVAMTSAVAETKITGDPGNEQGFKTSGGVLLPAGAVVWSVYLTNDTTAPSGSPCVALAGRDFLTFENLFFVGANAANAACVSATTANSTNITLRGCVFAPSHAGAETIWYVGTGGQAANWLIEKCIFQSVHTGYSFYCELPTVTGADYDANIVLRNCLFFDAFTAINVVTSGALANKGGGVIAQNCTFYNGGIAMATAANLSTTVPCQVKNSLVSQQSVGLQAATLGQIVENYNLIECGTARTNVSAGANSIATFALAFPYDGGYSVLQGFQKRIIGELRAGSTALGFGNDTTPAALTDDLLSRPRPAGGGSTSNGIGAFERHDTGAREASVVDASTNSLRLTGPADQDLLIPVTAAATTLTVRVQYDANHGTTNKPQVILQANGEIGVSAQTVTAAGGTGAWETLTIGPFTPTAAGWVTVRLVSQAAAGNGIAYFDTITSTVAIGTGSEDYWKRGEPFPAATTSGSGGGGGPGHVLVVRGQNLPAY